MKIHDTFKTLGAAGALVVTLVGLPTPGTEPRPSSPAPRPAGMERVTIRKALDGDTAELEDGRRVRYIGVDSPEMEERFHTKARKFNAALVDGKEAWLEFDVERSDDYERTLAYVHVRVGKDLKMVNLELVRAGMARAYAPGLNEKHRQDFLEAQREAREAKRGLWSREADRREEYVATRRGHAFHRPGCAELAEVPAKALIRYASRDEAIDSGRSPCRSCKP